jgi:hypothetical protein
MTEAERAYYQQHYPQLEGKYDSSVIFILASLPRLSANGRLGFISSVTWQTGENYARTRAHVFAQYGLEELVNLPFDVFKEAYVDTGVYILTRTRPATYRVYQFPKKAPVTSLQGIPFADVPRELVGPPTFKIVLDAGANALLARVLHRPRIVPLGDFTKSTQGLAGNRFSRVRKAKGTSLFPFLEQGQVYRYTLAVEETTYTSLKDKPSLEVFYEAAPKLLIRRVINRQDRLMAAYTDQRMVFKKDVNPFVLADDGWDPYYVLAILNSSLVSYLYVNTSSIATKDDFRQTTLAELRRIPVPRFNPKDRRHTELSEMARSITERHKQLAKARTAHEQQALQRQVDALDKRIDELVNEVYEVTDAELHAIRREPQVLHLV